MNPEPENLVSRQSPCATAWKDELSRERLNSIIGEVHAWAHSYAVRAHLNQQDAEDCAQTTIGKLICGKFDNCRDESQLEAYLRVALHRSLITLLRQRRGSPGDGDVAGEVAEVKAGSAGAGLRRTERKQATAKAMARVRAFYSDHQWKAYYLVDISRLTLDDAAERANQEYPIGKRLNKTSLCLLCQNIRRHIQFELAAADVGPEDGTSLGADIGQAIANEVGKPPNAKLNEPDHGL
jgi:DNA-directed RNA polymerase specialized sigma24 family protein